VNSGVCDVVLVEQKLHPCWLQYEVVAVSVLWQWWTWMWCCGRNVNTWANILSALFKWG